MVSIIHTLASKKSYWISEDDLKIVKYGFYGRITQCGVSPNVYGIDVHLPNVETPDKFEFTLIDGISTRHNKEKSPFVDALSFVEYTRDCAEEVHARFDGQYSEIRKSKKPQPYRPMKEEEICTWETERDKNANSSNQNSGQNK